MFARNFSKINSQLLIRYGSDHQHSIGPLNRTIVKLTIRNYSESTYFERRLSQSMSRDDEENHVESKDPFHQIFKTKQFKKLYDTHQPLNTFQTILLAVGSSVGALIDPYRDDLVAISSETFIGHYALRNLYLRMKNDREGNRILVDRPRINSVEVDLDSLSKLPINTLGYQYVKFMQDNNITCDSRKSVKYVNDPDLAYVLQRYREVHDFTHLLYDQKTTILGEVVIKWIEAIQTEIPMCIGAALFGPLKLYPKQRELFKNFYLDWAIKNAKKSKPTFLVYYEQRWEQDLDELRKEMNIIPAPKIN